MKRSQSIRAKHHVLRQFPLWRATFALATTALSRQSAANVSPEIFHRDRNQDDCAYGYQSQLQPKVI
jgi:hypothetical protein